MDDATWANAWNDAWFWCFAVSVAVGLVWSIAREAHIRTINRESKAIQKNQEAANQVLHQVSEKIDASDASTKERFADIKQLILDIEKRQQNAELMRAIQGRASGQQINLHGGGSTQIGDGNEQR